MTKNSVRLDRLSAKAPAPREQDPAMLLETIEYITTRRAEENLPPVDFSRWDKPQTAPLTMPENLYFLRLMSNFRNVYTNEAPPELEPYHE